MTLLHASLNECGAGGAFCVASGAGATSAASTAACCAAGLLRLRSSFVCVRQAARTLEQASRWHLLFNMHDIKSPEKSSSKVLASVLLKSTRLDQARRSCLFLTSSDQNFDSTKKRPAHVYPLPGAKATLIDKKNVIGQQG